MSTFVLNMKKLFTPVELPSVFPAIAYGEHWLMMGSCFANEIGQRLQQGKFLCDLNPYGVLYNPVSISQALCEIMDGKQYDSSDLFLHQGLWHSRMHHGDFSTDSQEQTLQLINHRLKQSAEQLQQLDGLILTFGSAYVYEDKETGKVVGNCHKLPERQFRRYRLTTEEILASLNPVLDKLLVLRPALKVILTVSPIRHVRDGLHENQLSKATLLLAVDELCRKYPNAVFYFPAYELLQDEMRDYRFYADDLVHPSSLAVDMVWERFSSCAFTKETQQTYSEVEEVMKMLAHRPLHPESSEYSLFLSQIALKIDRLKQKYPYFDFQNK